MTHEIEVETQQPIKIDNKIYYRELSTIERTFLGREDHGILTFCLYLNGHNSGYQGFGNVFLDDYIKTESCESKIKRRGTAAGMDLLMQVIDMLGPWEEIPNKHVYALREDKIRGCGPLIVGLQSFRNDDHVLLLDDWRTRWFK
jgi:hypothetical protein